MKHCISTAGSVLLMTGLVSFCMWNLYKDSRKYAHSNFAGLTVTALHVHISCMSISTALLAPPIFYVCHWTEEAQWYNWS